MKRSDPPARPVDELFRAARALTAARLEFWLRPTGRLVERAVGEGPASTATAEQARRLARNVDRMARGPLRGTCLVRSLALVRLLRGAGVGDVRMRIGVRSDDGRLAAHAWVEHGGSRLGHDGATAASFLPLRVGIAPVKGSWV